MCSSLGTSISTAVLLACAVFLEACGTITPARHDRVPVRDRASDALITAGTPSLPLTGEYDARIFTSWTGPITARFQAEPTEEGFKANTPTGVAWDYVGGVEGALGPVMAPFLFPRGMILTWESGLPSGETPASGSIGAGSLASLRLHTRVWGDGRPVEVVYKDGRTIAAIGLKRASEAKATATNYQELWHAIDRTLRENIFDPALAESSQVESFVGDVRTASLGARDDLEFLFAIGASARERIKFSMPLLYPKVTEESRAVMAGVGEVVRPYRVQRDEASGIVTLKYEVLFDAETVRAGLQEAFAGSPTGLILDVRRCAGVDECAFAIASALFEKDIDAGYYFSRSARERALKAELGVEVNAPDTPESPDIPVVRVGDGGEESALSRAIDRDGLVRVRVTPGELRFAGPVAVLTSKRTAGTAESLIAALRASERVRTFGETTAGRPMISPEFDLGQGWAMRVAAADYAAPNGAKFSGKGLEPDAKSSRDEAPAAAKAWIEQQLADGKAAVQ